MTEPKKPARGGKREGAGRKPKPDEDRAIPKSVRLTAVQWRKYDDLGGAAWLRIAIDRAHARRKGG